MVSLDPEKQIILEGESPTFTVRVFFDLAKKSTEKL